MIRSRRRIGKLGLAMAITISLPLGVATVAGANQYGLRQWISSVVYGNISSIAEPTLANQPANSYAFYLHRSIVQSQDSNPGIIQAGWATVGVNAMGFDNCGDTGGATWAFTETKPAGVGTYRCHYHGVYSPPTDINFNVYTATSDVWNIKIGGVLDPDGPYSLGFVTGLGLIGGESFIATGGRGPVSSTCYGNGPSDWMYYAAFNGGGGGDTLVTPNSSTGAIVTGGWSIGNAPTPLCDSI